MKAEAVRDVSDYSQDSERGVGNIFEVRKSRRRDFQVAGKTAFWERLNIAARPNQTCPRGMRPRLHRRGAPV